MATRRPRPDQTSPVAADLHIPNGATQTIRLLLGAGPAAGHAATACSSPGAERDRPGPASHDRQRMSLRSSSDPRRQAAIAPMAGETRSRWQNHAVRDQQRNVYDRIHAIAVTLSARQPSKVAPAGQMPTSSPAHSGTGSAGAARRTTGLSVNHQAARASKFLRSIHARRWLASALACATLLLAESAAAAERS